MKVKNPGRVMSYFSLEKRNLLLITLTGILYNVGMVAGPFFEGRLAQCLFDITEKRKTWQDMLFLVLLYVGVIFLVQASRALKRFYVRRFANNTSRNMRHMLYNSMVHMEKRELEGQQLGVLMTKAISDVDACVEGMRKFTTEIFDTGVVMAAYAVLLCVYDIRLALLSCIFIPLAYVIAAKCKGKVTRYNEKYKKQAGWLNQVTMDLVGNALTYRVFGLEKQRREAYETQLGQYEKSAVRANVWESAMQPVYHVIAMCGAVLIFYFGGKNVLGTGWTSWDIGVFTTFFSCFAKLSLKSSKAAKLFNAVQKAEVSWKRIQPMFREYIEEEGIEEQGEVEKLCFHHVDIAYPCGQTLLKHITFEAQKGQIIGVTGAVACGKSALGKLFIGETGYEGSVRIDDQEYADLSEGQKRSRVTYMGHAPELMSSSMEENICLGAEHGTGNVSMEQALELVCMRTEAEQMPEGLQTMVGDGGVRLSGGQQARVALARTVYHGKSILILDDPFSAVDKKTEKEIFRNLQSYGKDKIILLLSHRLALFPELAGVLYLHDGTGTFGTHEELLEAEPGYADLNQVQGGAIHA